MGLQIVVGWNLVRRCESLRNDKETLTRIISTLELCCWFRGLRMYRKRDEGVHTWTVEEGEEKPHLRDLECRTYRTGELMGCSREGSHPPPHGPVIFSITAQPWLAKAGKADCKSDCGVCRAGKWGSLRTWKELSTWSTLSSEAELRARKAMTGESYRGLGEHVSICTTPVMASSFSTAGETLLLFPSYTLCSELRTLPRSLFRYRGRSHVADEGAGTTMLLPRWVSLK